MSTKAGDTTSYSAQTSGTLEIGGLSVIQGMEIIRGCRGLSLVGCDLVEVSPPLNLRGATAAIAANLLYEMLVLVTACQLSL